MLGNHAYTKRISITHWSSGTARCRSPAQQKSRLSSPILALKSEKGSSRLGPPRRSRVRGCAFAAACSQYTRYQHCVAPKISSMSGAAGAEDIFQVGCIVLAKSVPVVSTGCNYKTTACCYESRWTAPRRVSPQAPSCAHACYAPHPAPCPVALLLECRWLSPCPLCFMQCPRDAGSGAGDPRRHCCECDGKLHSDAATPANETAATIRLLRPFLSLTRMLVLS